MSEAAATTPLHYQFLGRVASYSLVSYACDKATSYYTGAKAQHALVKSSLELAEQGLVKVGSAPVVSGLGQYCQPLLSKADHFACQQLDRLEDHVIKPVEEVRVNISVAKVQAKGKQLVNDKLVDPVTTTYENVKILPLVLTNRALDFAESFVDYLVPEPELVPGDAHEEEREAKEEAEGPTRGPSDSKAVPTFKSVSIRATRIPVTVTRRARRRVATRYTAVKTSARARLAKVQAQATQLLAYVIAELDRRHLSPAQVLRVIKLNYKRAPELAKHLTQEIQKWISVRTGAVSTTTVTNYVAHVSESFLELLNNLRQVVVAKLSNVATKTKQTTTTAQKDNEKKDHEEKEDVLIPVSGQATHQATTTTTTTTQHPQANEEEDETDDSGEAADSDVSDDDEGETKETEDGKGKH